MPESIDLVIDGVPVKVPAGTTVAAAILRTGASATRTSVGGQPRGPLCGMGICFECRAVVDGARQTRTCQTLCLNGMEVQTGA